MGKGQKPTLFSVPSSPQRGGQPCFLAQRRETNVHRQNKGKGVQKTPQNLFAGSERFQRPGTSPQLPCTPAQLSEPHRGCQACHSRSLPLSSDISHTGANR